MVDQTMASSHWLILKWLLSKTEDPQLVSFLFLLNSLSLELSLSRALSLCVYKIEACIGNRRSGHFFLSLKESCESKSKACYIKEGDRLNHDNALLLACLINLSLSLSSSTLTLQPQDVPLSSSSSSSSCSTKHRNSTSKLFKKSWYQKAIDQLLILLWKPVPPSPTSQTISKSKPSMDFQNLEKPKLRKCSSLKVAKSFTRVCLCAPISSYNEVFQSDVPPRRSYSYPRSKSYVGSERTEKFAEKTTLNYATTQRKIFRGKSLSDDLTMRRFIIEEAMMQQQRRRCNQIEFVRKRNSMRRKQIGPSPLCKMSINEEDR
ncbi:hypothetical protein LUZ60_004419 [Juncus effusus]|nr:hypothetical protein LUZ60_004419 [Juncus effusus]